MFVQIRVFFEDPKRFNIVRDAYEQAVSDIQKAVRLWPAALRPRTAPTAGNAFANLLAHFAGSKGGTLEDAQSAGQASPAPALGFLRSPLAVVDALASILRHGQFTLAVHIMPTHAAELLVPECTRSLGGNGLIEGLWSWRRPTNLLSNRVVPVARAEDSSAPDAASVSPAWGKLPQLLEDSAVADGRAAQFASLGPAIQYVVQQSQRNLAASADSESGYDHVFCVLDGTNRNLQTKLNLGVGSEVIVLEDGLGGVSGLASLRQLYNTVATWGATRPGTRVLMVFALDFRE